MFSLTRPVFAKASPHLTPYIKFVTKFLKAYKGNAIQQDKMRLAAKAWRKHQKSQ